ncbi:MAG: hypothetical protein WBN09_12380 [Woeseiaceae bacterium]
MHWDIAYEGKPPTAVSWYQQRPEQSLRMIDTCRLSADAPILDAGAGASNLVDCLLDEGFQDVSILDISATAMQAVRQRLGIRAAGVTMLVSNVLGFVPDRRYALWHDRASFHFLTEAAEQLAYVELLRQSLRLNGYLVLATFGPEGPQRCSGLAVQRYDVEQLQEILGTDFVLRSHILHDHHTPNGSVQQFQYSCWQFGGDTSKSEGR